MRTFGVIVIILIGMLLYHNKSMGVSPSPSKRIFFKSKTVAPIQKSSTSFQSTNLEIKEKPFLIETSNDEPSVKPEPFYSEDDVKELVSLADRFIREDKLYLCLPKQISGCRTLCQIEFDEKEYSCLRDVDDYGYDNNYCVTANYNCNPNSLTILSESELAPFFDPDSLITYLDRLKSLN